MSLVTSTSCSEISSTKSVAIENPPNTSVTRSSNSPMSPRESWISLTNSSKHLLFWLHNLLLHWFYLQCRNMQNFLVRTRNIFKWDSKWGFLGGALVRFGAHFGDVCWKSCFLFINFACVFFYVIANFSFLSEFISIFCYFWCFCFWHFHWVLTYPLLRS